MKTVKYSRHFFGESTLGNKEYAYYVSINGGRNLIIRATYQNFSELMQIYEDNGYEFDQLSEESHV